MLEVVHMLIKYVKRHDVFICELIDVMKSTIVDLHNRLTLCWFFCKYDDFAFNEFTIVCEH